MGTLRRAVVLDDRPRSLRAIAEAVRASALAVVAVTSDPGIALAAVPRADLAILAVDGPSGLAVVREALAANPALVAVALADTASREAAKAADAAGAAALIPRSHSPAAFASALREVLEREAQEPGGGGETSPQLTSRELQLLELVASGRSNADVARELWIAEQTVKFHLTRIYRKLGVRNRTAAARWADARGLIDRDRRHG